ncbi:EAL domain-containing protein [Ketobacter sp.]|uniref:two-component system response regulator n=1 Tax=Ketobacter sp. TaxID=2083498 RepID=UPI000F0E9B51|nr:EAL domain-containing protein [Ketobacter sp.]RLU00789.1 MAG: EAL domain-containing protein [Ketobacter sp.]
MHEQKVLIVEDENIVAMDLSRRLAKLGYTVVGMASSGNRALELVDTRSPDIILMDIHIRGTADGIEVADQINAQHQIPVIFLTAYSEDTTLARAKQTRPYGYLLKPFSERELHVAIQVALERHREDQQRIQKQTHLQRALDAAHMGTWEMTATAEPEADTGAGAGATILSYSPTGHLTRFDDWRQFIGHVVVRDRSQVSHTLEQLQQNTNAELSIEFEANLPRQGHRWFKLCGKSFSSGDQQRVVGILQDVTEHHHSETALKQAATAFTCSADGIVVLDQDLRILSVNQSFCRIVGQPSEQCLGQELALLSPEALGPEHSDSLWKTLHQTGSWQGEASFHRHDNRLLHVLLNIGSVPERLNQEAQYVVVVSDVTPMHHEQQKLSHIAYYDSLTGLPNRNLFLDRLEQCMAKARRQTSRFGVLFLDLDHFKQVNDSLGHAMGDRLLKAVAQRLKSQLRSSDTLCRIGGDEFIVIAEAVQATEDLELLAKKILSLLNHPIRLGNTEVQTGVSIGIGLYPDHSRDRDELIKMADTAMYSAKTRGRQGYALYHSAMHKHVAQHLHREQELRHALNQGHLTLHYQPQYHSRNGQLTGLEALLRWQHPSQGLLCASDIIPLAESSSLMQEIGNWVIEESCRQLREWSDQGFQPPRLSLNVSARQLQDRNFAHLLNHHADLHQVPLQRLAVQVTESCLQKSDSGLHNLRRLHKLGLSIAIDGFGSGYFSLSSLHSLPVTQLNIDRCFIQNLDASPRDRAVTNAIIAMATQLELNTVAVGIENQGQAQLITCAGCSEVQGNFFCPPLPARQIMQRLNTAPTDTHYSEWTA